MTLNELRIGNWVDYNNSSGSKVRLRIDVYLLCYMVEAPEPFNKHGYGVTYESNIEPIPLSPEILVKCGFEKRIKVIVNPETNSTYYNYFWFKDFVLKFRNDCIECARVVIKENQPEYSVESFLTSDLQYLHQLQNLYFAIKNEELKYIP